MLVVFIFSTTPTHPLPISPFPINCGHGSQWKGGKGRTYCEGRLPESSLLTYPQADCLFVCLVCSRTPEAAEASPY